MLCLLTERSTNTRDSNYQASGTELVLGPKADMVLSQDSLEAGES